VKESKKLMSNTDYHANEALGSSLLKLIHLKSVLHAITKEFTQSEAMAVGSAVHSLVLEPETFTNEYAVSPKCDRRTKIGKAVYADFLADSEGKTVLSEASLYDVKGMATAVMEHPIASRVLTGGRSEYSYFSVDKETGIEKKCRPDYENGGALIDLKSTRDASFEGFAKQMGDLGYLIQAAWYLDVYNEATGEDLKEFFIVAVENFSPYAVAVYKIDEMQIEVGRKQYRKALTEYASFLKDCEEVGEPKAKMLHGYPAEITTIQVPYWFLDQIKGA